MKVRTWGFNNSCAGRSSHGPWDTEGDVPVSPIAFALITLLLAAGGVGLGRFLARRSPQGLSAETKDFVKIAVTLMTLMVALLLSLQLSSVKTAFDSQERQVTDVSAQVVFLDRALALSGRGSAAGRAMLRAILVDMLRRSWPDAIRGIRLETPPDAEAFYDTIERIVPTSASQGFAKSSALAAALDIGKTLRLISQENSSSAAVGLLAVEMAWTTGIFVFYGLLAPSNRASLLVLVVSAVAIASAIFLIAEMSSPFSGIIRISSAPLQHALTEISR